MAPEIRKEKQMDYFSRPGGVSRWWNPEEGVYRAHYARELRVLEENLEIDPAWKVADLGTGQGRFARFFASKGCEVTAVDVNEEMLALAKSRAESAGVGGGIKFVRSAAEDFLEGREGGFDLVSCMELIDHIAEPEKLIAAIRDSLKPGGRLVMSYVPESSLYGVLFGIVMKTVKSGELQIANIYPPARIEGMLADAGFEFKSFGIGLATLIVRETLSKYLKYLLALPIAVEGAVKPYFRSPFFARRCIHVVVIAVKK